MKEYLLFLDESKPTPPSVHFCLGGCAIEKTEYETKIKPYISEMKKGVFGDENIILHETEIRASIKTQYKPMRKKENRELFWSKMGNLFDTYNITVFSATIEPGEQKRIFNSKYLNDEYFICLEIVLERYAHFLEKNNAIGSVCIESQNLKADNRLNNHFQKLIKRGTRYLNNMAMRQITNINFYMKSDLNIGLQIADFIPNTIKKYSIGIEQKKPTIEANIVKKLYDGYNGMPCKFGAYNLK